MSSDDMHGSGISYSTGSHGQYGGAKQLDNGAAFAAGARSISQSETGVFGESGSYAPGFSGVGTGISPPSPTIDPIHTFADAFAIPDGKFSSDVPTPSRKSDEKKDPPNSEGPAFPPLTDQFDPGLTNGNPSEGSGVSPPSLTTSAIPEPFTLPIFVAGFIGALIIASHGRLFSQFFSLLQLFRWSRNRLAD